MQTDQRWQMAQDYERRHWESVARRILEGRSDLKWYEWKAGRTLRRLGECGIVVEAGAWLAEIGSGPVGQLGFLPGGRRVALDPLTPYFEKNDALLRERPSNVEYTASKGESLPLPDRGFDLAVIDNCLDHCESPARVLSEIHRILKPGGCLYLTLNVRPVAGWLAREAAERVARADRGHPHSYHPRRLQDLVESAGFSERRCWLQSWGGSIRENWSESRWRTAAKLATATLERLYEGVWLPR